MLSALFGHTITQSPQPLQRLGLTAAFFLSFIKLITLGSGHVTRQILQPMHFCSSTFAEKYI
jgi:hypothetical protein